MDKFEKTLRDIKSLRIQGAENVAINAVKALEWKCSSPKTQSPKKFISEMEKAKRSLFSTRPTEPLMRNALNYVTASVAYSGKYEKNNTQIKKSLHKSSAFALSHFEAARRSIAAIGAKKIENGMTIFTHCHSSTVMGILKAAKSQGKKFTVFNTESRPLLQGRTSAKELAKLRIPVTHFVDSAAKIAIKKSDIVLFGFDAVTTTKVYNKIGSEMFALMADKYDIPLFACGDSWKFDPECAYGNEEKIELRPSKEIWPSAPKGVKIENPSFERIDPRLITAIISELGVYGHENFIEEVKKAYPWLSG